MKSKSKHVLRLLGNRLNKKYERNAAVTFTDLLEWDLWPGFFNIYYGTETNYILRSIANHFSQMYH